MTIINVVVSSIDSDTPSAFLAFEDDTIKDVESAQAYFGGPRSSEQTIGVYPVEVSDNERVITGQRQLLETALQALLKLNAISANHEIEDILATFFIEGFKAGVSWEATKTTTK